MVKGTHRTIGFLSIAHITRFVLGPLVSSTEQQLGILSLHQFLLNLSLQQFILWHYIKLGKVVWMRICQPLTHTAIQWHDDNTNGHTVS